MDLSAGGRILSIGLLWESHAGQQSFLWPSPARRTPGVSDRLQKIHFLRRNADNFFLPWNEMQWVSEPRWPLNSYTFTFTTLHLTTIHNLLHHSGIAAAAAADLVKGHSSRLTFSFFLLCNSSGQSSVMRLVSCDAWPA